MKLNARRRVLWLVIRVCRVRRRGNLLGGDMIDRLLDGRARVLHRLDLVRLLRGLGRRILSIMRGVSGLEQVIRQRFRATAYKPSEPTYMGAALVTRRTHGDGASTPLCLFWVVGAGSRAQGD